MAKGKVYWVELGDCENDYFTNFQMLLNKYRWMQQDGGVISYWGNSIIGLLEEKDKEIFEIHELLRAAGPALRSYQCGNEATGLAKTLADQIDEFLREENKDD